MPRVSRVPDSYGPQRTRPNVIVEPVAKGSPEYKMNHRGGRGYAIILNQTVFSESSGLKERKYSEDDVQLLKATYRALGFKEEEIIVKQDLKRASIYELLDTDLHNKELYDFKDKDCLSITVLSHGSKGSFWAQDQPFEITNLWESLRTDPIPELAGKPKLFFIDCSKGDKMDEGTSIIPQAQQMGNAAIVDSDNNQFDQTYKIPEMADYFFAYSTSEEHKAYNVVTNSPFIEALHGVFTQNLEKEDKDKVDLFSMMTTVTRRVATQFKDAENDMKQCPSCTSTLIRKIYFRDTGDIQTLQDNRNDNAPAQPQSNMSQN